MKAFLPGLKLAFTKDKKLFPFSSLLEIGKVSEERLPKRSCVGRGSMKVPFGWILCPNWEPRLGGLRFLTDKLWYLLHWFNQKDLKARKALLLPSSPVSYRKSLNWKSQTARSTKQEESLHFPSKQLRKALLFPDDLSMGKSPVFQGRCLKLRVHLNFNSEIFFSDTAQNCCYVLVKLICYNMFKYILFLA